MVYEKHTYLRYARSSYHRNMNRGKEGKLQPSSSYNQTMKIIATAPQIERSIPPSPTLILQAEPFLATGAAVPNPDGPTDSDVGLGGGTGDPKDLLFSLKLRHVVGM